MGIINTKIIFYCYPKILIGLLSLFFCSLSYSQIDPQAQNQSTIPKNMGDQSAMVPDSASKLSMSLTPGEIVTRGKSLRQAIDSKHQELESPNGALFDAANTQQDKFRVVDVSEVFWQYLSRGMPLKVANSILENAGFLCQPIVSGPNQDDHDRSVITGIGGIIYITKMQSTTSLAVIALPPTPDSQSLFRIKAAFIKYPR